MTPAKRETQLVISDSVVARTAGTLYLIFSATVAFTLYYVPTQIDLRGEALQVVNNVLADESTFRLGVAAELFAQTILLLLSLALYRLFSPANKHASALMTASIAIMNSLVFVAVVNKLDILSLAHIDTHGNAIEKSSLIVQVRQDLDAYNNGSVVAFVFWGLWLFSLGYLVFNSDLFPKTMSRVLGALLAIGSLTWFVEVARQTLFPQYTLPATAFIPSALGEFGVFFWLLIMGSKAQRQ